MTDPQPFVLELWPPADLPAAAGHHTERDFLNESVDRLRFLYNVSVPTLTCFLPDPAISTGTAMVVCPGGGLFTLAIDYEGMDVARWLCERGIAAFVLKYRLIQTDLAQDAFLDYFGSLLNDLPQLVELSRQHTPTVVADGQKALSIVRQRAGEWGINPNRVGMMGFSAGAFVTVMTTLHAPTHRPDYAASIYGALWELPDAPAALPPMFIALADDDSLTIEPSLQLYSAWHKAQRPVEMHIYAGGGHGFGMRKINPATDAWIDRLYEWMQTQGVVTPR